jgi:peptidoglycan/xylan/chitin deacetylase (PgdA/CDA1 family)
MKRQLKAAIGWFLFSTGLYRKYFRDMAVVVLFHRVDDRYPGNPISCSEAEFRGFLDFFQKYFQVIGMSELVHKLQSGADISGQLVVTFDDGYKDNRKAADELLRRRLPASFFIATNFIESDRVPWWDVDSNIKSEWMSWDDVRSLATDGFELGSHTQNHVDLGVVAGEAAEQEIDGARDRLQQETGTTVTLFSYPYGRVNQLSDANREYVKRSGFSCCPSAFGGNVHKGDDPFSILRTPISPWHKSPYQFGLESILAK